MTGVRLAWYRVASHLHIPVEELRERISLTEFLDWIAYLEVENERRTKSDFYFAQLAAEVRRSYSSKPNRVKVSEFYMTFVTQDPEERMKNSKENWARGLGIRVKAT